MREVNAITQFCFAMEIPGFARLVLDKIDEPRGMEKYMASADRPRF